MPGLSKWVANGTLYYQHDGFEARISDNYRSSFLGEVSGISATRIEQTIKGGSSYDAQVSYSFDSGALKGLTLIAQGSNLSNKTFVTYQNNDPRQVQTWESYGRRLRDRRLVQVPVSPANVLPDAPLRSVQRGFFF